jgi:hypothetical protein
MNQQHPFPDKIPDIDDILTLKGKWTEKSFNLKPLLIFTYDFIDSPKTSLTVR